MLNRFFKNPFGKSGDRVAVPDDIQLDGSVSFDQGFGYDYSRDLASDPLAKGVPRDQTNQIYYDITKALQEYQTSGIPDYIDPTQNDGTAYAYGKLAVVRYGTSVYVSLKDGNTSLPSVVADWDEVPGTKATTAEAIAGTDDTKIMTPAKVKAAVSASQAVVNNEATTYKLMTVNGVLAIIEQ